MSCEQYKASLIDAALGALEPACDAELRAHLAECGACRATFEEERRLAAAIERGLEHSVAAQPSPEFATRVRMRLAEERVRGRSWLPGWIPATAGALAVLLLLAVWMARREAVPPDKLPELAQQKQIEQLAPPPSEPLVTAKSGRGERLLVARRQPAPREPEVLVPAGQWEAILRLYETAQNPRVDASALLEKPKEKLEIDELKVTPLEVAPLEPEPRSGPPGRER